MCVCVCLCVGMRNQAGVHTIHPVYKHNANVDLPVLVEIC